jgi:3-phosphoshikimate 1-carboxyvinyltransferase
MKVQGTVVVPGDKSISHRALILGALATGTSRVKGLLASADVESTSAVLQSLGALISSSGDDVVVHGAGLRALHAPKRDLDCGNSGTTARLMTGVVAGSGFTSRLVGDDSLSKRPMRRVSRPLEAMGASFEFERDDGLPMRVHGGTLHPIDWTSEVSSAQVKSAILLAAVVGGVGATVREPAPSRNHTESMLRARGATVHSDGPTTTVEPPEHLMPHDVRIPGDPSSAAFFVALAALASTGELFLPGVLVNPTRGGFIAALRRMGARIAVEDTVSDGGESSGTLRVSPSELVGTFVGTQEIPSMIDELPLLACVAARAEGETIISGASELRVKESDRIAVVVSNLHALGVSAEELPDGMRIVGTKAPLRGVVRTHRDHRIAMAFGVLGALDGNEIWLDDTTCVGVSYPGFWGDLARAHG